MKCLYILFIVLFSCSACGKRSLENHAEKTAIAFSEAFYNLDYGAAKKLVTPSSLLYLRFLASNTSQELLDEVQKKGAVDVSIVDAQVEGDNQAIVICLVKNYLETDYLTRHSTIGAEKKDTLHLVKEGNEWLVKMDIPQQSGKQNHD